jgi:type II secretory pathway component PulK
MLPGASIGLKDSVKKLTDALDLSGSLVVNVYGESGKLNLNRLIWRQETRPTAPGGANPNTPPPPPANTDPNANPLLKIRQSYAATLNEMLRQKRDESDEFRLKYEGISGEILIGNVLAWIDSTTQVDGEGAPKEGFYRDLNPKVSIKNAPLYSLDELHLVKDFDDELIEFMKKNFTALLTEGINANSIDESLIKALFPKIDEDTLKKFTEKRTETGFSKPDDFWKFMNELGFGQEDKKVLDDAGITIVTTETAFRVEIEARSGDARKVWVAHLGAAPPKAAPQTNQPVQIDPNTGLPLNNPNTSTAATASNDNTVPLVVYLKTD